MLYQFAEFAVDPEGREVLANIFQRQKEYIYLDTFHRLSRQEPVYSLCSLQIIVRVQPMLQYCKKADRETPLVKGMPRHRNALRKHRVQSLRSTEAVIGSTTSGYVSAMLASVKSR